MRTEKVVEITRERHYVDVAPDYTKVILNHTDELIRVVDDRGRIRFIEPLPKNKRDPNVNAVYIEEWFYGIQMTDSIKRCAKVLTGRTCSDDAGIIIRYTVHHKALDDVPEGIYIDGPNIHLSIARYDCQWTHPDASPELIKMMNAHLNAGIVVEAWDPRRCMNTMYVNINGRVYKVIPKRMPTPLDEGVRITIPDGSGGVATYHYPLKDLLYGEGRHGIRFYKNETDALDDDRHPDKAAILKEKEELRLRRKAIYQEGYEAAKEKITLSYEEKIKKIKEEAEERFERAKEKEYKIRQTIQNDKTSLWSNVVKFIGAIFTFFRGIFA